MSEPKQTLPPQRHGHGFGPNLSAPVEKAKNFQGSLRRLIGYLRPRAMQFIIVFILAIASTVFSVVGPKIMGQATTRIFENLMAIRAKVPGAAIDFHYIGQIALILIVLYAISSAFAYAQQYIMVSVTQDTVYKMRNDINQKLAHLPLRYFDTHTHGEILSRITNDIDNISNTMQQSLAQIVSAIVTVIGIIIMMLMISPWLTLIGLTTLPVSGLVTALVAKRSQKHFSDQQDTLGELNGHVEEMYTGHRIVKVFGRTDAAIAEFEELNHRLYDVGWKAQFMAGIIMPLMRFISNIGYVLICVVGGIFVTRRLIPIGDIQAFMQYSRQFTQPIIQVASIANVVQSTIASAERVFEVLDETEEVPDPAVVPMPAVPRGQVSFEQVEFGYHPETPVIQNMSVDVQPGQVVAIVGPTGAGKTTLVNLLMRFYDVNSGRITVDGRDIRELPRNRLRSLFGMVLQDTWLFNGTIRDNIAYGKAGATAEAVAAAARAAHADYFIRTLPQGYETVLNEEASNISQGQRQLLTIARAILADPAILILDEATSSVDTRTEILIQRAMQSLMQGRTSFVIAHRLSTIRDADLILVMKDGRLVEYGRHQELLDRNGFYAELHASQFAAGNLAGAAVGNAPCLPPPAWA